MSETTGREVENTIENATDTHLKGLDSRLWDDLCALSSDEQYKRWIDLTQKHLTDFQEEKSNEKGFKREELELVFFNRLYEKELASLKEDIPLKGIFVNTGDELLGDKIQVENFGNFISIIEKQWQSRLKEKAGPFQVLVVGIGISGKATLRNVLSKALSERFPKKKILSYDRDYNKMWPIWEGLKGDVNIIEDVHGFDEEGDKLIRFNGREGLVDGYDMVVYVCPSKQVYKQSLLNRGVGWLKSEKLDLTAPGEKVYADGEQERIQQTADELERTWDVNRKWFREQLRVLKKLKNDGIPIAIVEPSEIFKSLYNFKESPDLKDKSFSEALKEVLEK